MPTIVNKYALADQAIRGGIAKAMAQAAQSHVAVAKQLAPVDTGFLRDNIKIAGGTFDESASRYRSTGSGRFSGPTDLAVESQAPYSTYVEFGTVNSAAQPFFYPAFESARRQFRQEAQEAVNAELAQVLK